ncbi:hypothetical protein AB0J52_22695, partial [Spirillospora sp. NPDC049652]
YLPVLATQLWPNVKWLQKVQPYLHQGLSWPRRSRFPGVPGASSSPPACWTSSPRRSGGR